MEDLPWFSAAEFRTPEALRAMLDRLVLELEPPPPPSPSVEEYVAIAGLEGAEAAVDRLQKAYERPIPSPPYYQLNDWLACELGEKLGEPVGLDPEARELATELLLRWMSISGTVGKATQALELAKRATQFALDDFARFRVQAVLCLAILRAREFEPPRTIRLAFAALRRARKLAVDVRVVDCQSAVWSLELECRMFAGCSEYVSVRQRLRHLGTAMRLANRIAVLCVDEGLRYNAEVKKARAEKAHAQLAALGWLHRLIGFAPNS